VNEAAVTPWYKQLWPWIVFSPMIFVVPAGFWMIYISVVTNDGSIVDNVYRDGRTYIERTEEDTMAVDLRLNAQMQMIGDQISLRLNGDLAQAPQSLSLLYIFDTSALYDHSVELNRTPDGRYTGKLTEPIEGQRSLLLEPINAEPHWRLHGQINLPTTMIQTLQPKVR